MNKIKTAIIRALLLILAVLPACTPATVLKVSNAVVLASGKTLQSEKTRVNSPEVKRNLSVRQFFPELGNFIVESDSK